MNEAITVVNLTQKSVFLVNLIIDYNYGSKQA